MAGQDLVRPSRDGDQFHYQWAARRCLELLPGGGNLVAVTVEGASADEHVSEPIESGEQIIDVGLYFGSEVLDNARNVRYIQLKHSTRHADEAWTASGLKKTILGFASRYAELVGRFSSDDVAHRFKFEFTTNRSIEAKLDTALKELGSDSTLQHSALHQTLIKYTGLDNAAAQRFFRIFAAEGNEDGLWAQRNLLSQDIGTYLPDADYDAPIQLKELVTRKATSEHESDPSIRRHDVLRALKVTDENLLFPAPCKIADPSNSLARDQEREILDTLLSAEYPIVIHADGGVGKSILAARLADSVPSGSVAILYDCFGDGLYRNALHFRHRHRDVVAQIANELAAQSLCHPLIPTHNAEPKQYLRALIGRLEQASGLLRSRDPFANLCLIIDAADNAEIAAQEQRESGSFVRDLIRIPLPAGVHLAFTCRTHRRDRLGAAPTIEEILLRPFCDAESARHLRSVHPSACDVDVKEFAFLSSANPRVQALALSQGLPLQETLKQLGPTPTTVDQAIGDLLEKAVRRLCDEAGQSDTPQIDLICQGLAVLRPLVPITVLSRLSGAAESAVRSFALDFGKPLLLKGDSLQFLDEPAETWFREHFRPDDDGLCQFLERLRPITAESSYAAAMLPELLLQAGKLDELVELALSGQGLPAENPLEKRDVEVQRLTFALKACLRQQDHKSAAKLALKAAGECAGEQRQNELIQSNTDLAALLMAPDRVEDLVSRRIFGTGWKGGHHAYDACLLSGREEFSAEGSSRLRMAMDWLRAWALRSGDDHDSEEVSDEDRTELALALLRLRGAKAAIRFLRRWRWRCHAFEAAKLLGQRLADLYRYDQIDELAEAAGFDVWLLLGLSVASAAVKHPFPAGPLSRLLRLLAHRRLMLREYRQWDSKWHLLDSVRSAIELALLSLPKEPERWACILEKYIPCTPPRDLTHQYGVERGPLLRAYALEAALTERQIEITEIAPSNVRKQLDGKQHYGGNRDFAVFEREVGGILPWIILSTEVACGRFPDDLRDAINKALGETATAKSRIYNRDNSLEQAVAQEWFRVLRDTRSHDGPAMETFRDWMAREDIRLWDRTLISICRLAAHANGFESFALDIATRVYSSLDASREDAETRLSSMVQLARAILPVSQPEASMYFNRAIELASRIGEENLSRWDALLYLAQAAGERSNPRPRTGYRLSRAAELTYEYVLRDKHFAWNETVEALTSLCPSSALTILSRWRDRRFGYSGRLLPPVIYKLLENGEVPAAAPIVFTGLDAEFEQFRDLKRAIEAEANPVKRKLVAEVAYRYMRVQASESKSWSDLKALATANGLELPDLDRLITVSTDQDNGEEERLAYKRPQSTQPEHRAPDWNEIFNGVNLTDSDALRAAYARVRTYDPPFKFETFFREALSRVGIGRQPQLVHAIAAWPDFEIFELRYLLNAVPMPWPKQLSLRKALREAVLTACRREPERVERRPWYAMLPFRELDAANLVSDQEVVHAALEGFTEQAELLGANALFKLVDPLSSCLSPSEADEALNFGLDLLEHSLESDDGDGPWRPELEPPESRISALSGYVWSGLGSPVAAERWHYAHVVRSAIELGWSELLDELLSHATSGCPGPFVDQGLEFYLWHARQWLVIGIARGSLENPSCLRPWIPLLQQWSREHHVLIRVLSSQVLRTLIASGELTTDEAADVEQVNCPVLGEEIYTGWMDLEEDTALDSGTSDGGDDSYYFGIDIVPYWFAPLGRVFGLSQQAIERRALNAIRTRIGWHGSGWRQDARRQRKIFADDELDSRHSSLPRTDNIVTYHGYHAMMMVAADLLKERPVRRNAENSIDEFKDWLSDYLLPRSDWRWLADRRDPELRSRPQDDQERYDKSWRWNVTAAYLEEQLATDDGMRVVWGDWSGGDGDRRETVSVRSAFVSRTGAEALVTALQTAPELGYHVLPGFGDDGVVEAGELTLRGWIEHWEVSPYLEEFDPWSEGLRYPGPAPSRETIERIGLSPSSDGRSWRIGADGCLRSETWTVARGYGREAEIVPGSRLSCDEGFLQRLLDTNPEERLIVSVEIQRWPPRYEREKEESIGFVGPYARYYLIGDDGVPHAL